jgi:hypothetical protein
MLKKKKGKLYVIDPETQEELGGPFSQSQAFLKDGVLVYDNQQKRAKSNRTLKLLFPPCQPSLRNRPRGK